MNGSSNANRDTVRVLVATPLGQGGQGGIDRIMDEVRHALKLEPRPGVEVEFRPTRGKGSILRSPLVLAGFLARMAALRRAGKVDLLHVNLSSHGSTSRKLIVCALARRLGIPYVLHLHGSRFRQYWDGAPAKRSAAIKAMFEGAAAALVLGGVWRDFIAARAPQTRIVILPNATRRPEAAASAEAQPPHILFLGRIGERKGVPDLISALALLPPDSRWTATLAGDGDVEAAKALAEAKGLERIRFTGWVGPEAVADLLSQAQILVLPSYDENLPMSVIEGMANGLAVVATPVGATADIIQDGTTGLLTPPGDPQRLAEALARLIDDPPLRARLGLQARAFHGEHLEIGNYVSRLASVWREAAVRP